MDRIKKRLVSLLILKERVAQSRHIKMKLISISSQDNNLISLDKKMLTMLHMFYQHPKKYESI